MKLLISFLFAISMIACAPKNGSDGQNGRDGDPGISIPGNNGNNGHSIVANGRFATAQECPVSGGTAVDFYVDLDDSLNFTAGDLIQAGVIACNGAPGEDGEDGSTGPQGMQGIPGAPGSSAVMTAISLATVNQCVNIHTNLYAMRADSTQVALYNGAQCDISQRISVGPNSVALNSTLNEMFIYMNVVFLLEGNDGSTVLKKLVFQ